MNDNALRKYSYSSSHKARSGSVSHTRPPANVLIDGYKTLSGDAKEGLSYRNSVSRYSWSRTS